MSLAALLKGGLPPRVPEHVVGSSDGAGPSSLDEQDPDSPAEREKPPPGRATLYGAFEHEAFDENGDEDGPLSPVVPGQGKQRVLEASDVDEQVERLQAWEEQLQQYSDSLTEKGWEEWKKGQVTQIMQQLRRTVVPDVWKEAVERAEAEARMHKERVELSATKEAALLKRIDELENGPGCARELREKLEAAELQLSQQRAREKQQSVFKQLLTTGAVSANAGGGAPALRKRRATVAGSDGSSAGAMAEAQAEAAKGFLENRGQSVPTTMSGADAEPHAEVDGEGEDEGEDEEGEAVAVLQMQLTRARQEAAEATDELSTLKAQYDERTATLEAALEEERKQRRHATEALESQHVSAGVHEAQEMVQLRMELVAANEELDFLRSRESKVHEEETRLQMVAEMSKRLGTNVSRFELESLRSRVASLQEEAERVHAHNQQLQREAKRSVTDADAVATLKAEISAFQVANDALEGRIKARDAHEKKLEGLVQAANARIELLQRQLVLSHEKAKYQLERTQSVSTGGMLTRSASATLPQQQMQLQQAQHMQQAGQPVAFSRSPTDGSLVPSPVPWEDAPENSGGGGIGSHPMRRKSPLLYEGSPGEGPLPIGRLVSAISEEEVGDGRVPPPQRMPLVPLHTQGSQPELDRIGGGGGVHAGSLMRVASRQGSTASYGGGGGVTMAAGGGGGTTMFGGGIVMGPGGTLTSAPPVAQRAVALHDDVASVPILIERIDPAKPTVAKPIPHDAYRTVSVTDNSTELAAERARQQSEGRHEVHLAKELKRSADASSQELRVVKASVAAQVLHARVAKLGSLSHYGWIAMMRCLRKWAMLLELDDAYHAALSQAAEIIEYKAANLHDELEQSSERTVKALLVQPQMLGELGEMRRKLQMASSTTSALRGGLQQLVQAHEAKTLKDEADRAVLTPRQWLPLESGALALKQRFAPELVTPAAAAAPTPEELSEAEVARKKAAELHLLQQERLIDALKLKLRLTLHHWRRSRFHYEKQGVLVNTLSAARNEELEASKRLSEQLRRLELEKHELLVEQSTWRKQSAEQAEVIAQAVAQAANGTIEHENEVLILSEKLRQVLDEKAGLEALVDSQQMDLKIMSSEMIRMMGN